MGQASNFVTDENIRIAREAVRESGAHLFPAAIAQEFCDHARTFIDRHQDDDGVENNYAGTEVRIWKAETRDEGLKEFWAASNDFISRMESTAHEAYTLLAIRNLPVAVEDSSLTRGRWHIDSYRRQLKVFLFLSDTSDASGPFEYIPGTHATGFKAKMLLKGEYVTPTDILKGTRSYSKLDDTLVDSVAEIYGESHPVICQAGSVLVVDTSAIHRARPCVSVPRYALTSYFH